MVATITAGRAWRTIFKTRETTAKLPELSPAMPLPDPVMAGYRPAGPGQGDHHFPYRTHPAAGTKGAIRKRGARRVPLARSVAGDRRMRLLW